MSFAMLLSVPIALDGEAASGNNSALGVISVLSIVVGWVLLAALWYFVFRRKASEKRDDRSSE
ncbi:MAG: hypothetical protein ACLQMH_07025 [Solirubrobacteraceae bacterium]